VKQELQTSRATPYLPMYAVPAPVYHSMSNGAISRVEDQSAVRQIRLDRHVALARWGQKNDRVRCCLAMPDPGAILLVPTETKPSSAIIIGGVDTVVVLPSVLLT
jgi:hypothetical protein